MVYSQIIQSNNIRINYYYYNLKKVIIAINFIVISHLKSFGINAYTFCVFKVILNVS